MQIKPGIKTSEFYVTMLPVVIAGLVFSGVIGEGDTDYIIALIKDVIAGVVALFSIVSYIFSRSQLKKESLKVLDKDNGSTQTQSQTTQVHELG